MRIQFKGPAGSKFEGLDLRGIKPTEAKIRDMAAIQTATGFKLDELNRQFSANETLGMQAVIFFTLRNAGLFVTWDEVGDFAQGDIVPIEEPGDRAGVEADVEDPQAARTDSAPGAAAGSAETTDLPKRVSRGSRTRSAVVS